MQCIECGAGFERLDNDHLLRCCGLTLHEYALRHALPLDLLVAPDRLNVREPPAALPRPELLPGEQARSVLWGLNFAGLVHRHEEYCEIPGDIRRLDLLLWDLRQLGDYAFRFCQEYRFDTSSNRVVADNCLRARTDVAPRAAQLQLSLTPPPDFRRALAVCVAHVGELHAGYLFLPVAVHRYAEDIRAWLRHHENIELVVLESADSVGGAVLRSHTRTDTERLFACLDSCLRPMPGVQARFHENTPQVTVVKEVVFDSAHFITDHPAKCSNLHGGRYKLQVKVAGRIDPCTGCVIDYGYLKRVVNRRVVEAFDHHTLNYVAAELAWRSSTEMLCVYIWERLIEYLPGMVELQLYETEQSWCHYRGPDLGVFQQQGGSVLLHHFTGMDAGDDELRQQLVTVTDKALSVVA